MNNIAQESQSLETNKINYNKNLQQEFLSELELKGRSKNTLKNYRTDLECFNQYLFKEQKNTNIAQFTESEMVEYGKYLQVKYTSDNSRRRRVQALRIFFDFLVEKKIFSTNPVLKIPISPKFVDIPRPATLVEIKTLWSYLLEESKSTNKIISLSAKRNQIIVLLIYGSALKVSDLEKLTVDHIFIDNNPRVLITTTKRDPYSIPLPPIFPIIYQDYLDSLEELKSTANLEFNKLLYNANPYRILSGGLSSRGIETIFSELRKKLLLNITAKSLRQACFFKWIQQKHSDSLIKEWLGVAPSYGLRPYKISQFKFSYHDNFIEELFKKHIN